MISKEDINKAVVELSTKSYKDIEKETAIKWAARAFAAQQLSKSTGEIEAYKHEAIEHASMAGSAFLSSIIKELEKLGELY